METTPVNPSKPAETQPVIAADNGSDAAGSGGSDISSRRPSRAVSSAPASSDVDLDMIKDAQGKLNALGFDAGTVDGKTGPRTRAAVKAFQAAAAVKVTGRIDAKLITQLDDALAGRLPLNRNSSPVQTSLSVVFGRDDLFGGYRFDAATMRIIGEAIGQSAERVQVGDKGMWSDTEPSGAHGTILMVGDASQVCQGRGQFGRTLTLTSTLPAGMVIEASGVSVCQTGPHAWLVL